MEVWEAMAKSCWSFDVCEKKFTSPYVKDWAISFTEPTERFISECQEWHSDMTGEQIYKLLSHKGLNPVWVKLK